MKIKNWEIKERANKEKKVVYEVYEELIVNENDDLMKYYHQTFTTLSEALHYIAERIGE